MEQNICSGEKHIKMRGIIWFLLFFFLESVAVNCGYVTWGILVLRAHTCVSLEKKEVPKLFKTFPTDLPQMVTS